LSTCQTVPREALPVAYEQTTFNIVPYDDQNPTITRHCRTICLPHPEMIDRLSLHLHRAFGEDFERFFKRVSACIERRNDCRNVSLLEVVIRDDPQAALTNEHIDVLWSVIITIECPGTFKLVIEEDEYTSGPTTSSFRFMAEGVNPSVRNTSMACTTFGRPCLAPSSTTGLVDQRK
jgi:hypothetical protein